MLLSMGSNAGSEQSEPPRLALNWLKRRAAQLVSVCQGRRVAQASHAPAGVWTKLAGKERETDKIQLNGGNMYVSE